jgi:putative acetyltransferase
MRQCHCDDQPQRFRRRSVGENVEVAERTLPPGLTLREWREPDTPAVQRLVASVLEEYGFHADPSTSEADLTDIRRSYFEKGGAFYVLTDDQNRLAGTAGFFPRSPDLCKLRKMYVAKSHRGLGLGRILLERVLKEAKSRHYAKVVLETSKVMTEAVGLYLSHGFRKVDITPVSPRCDTTFTLTL